MEHKVERTRTQVVQGANQDGKSPVVKRKTRGFEMTSRLTKRAIARILVAVQNKLHAMIENATVGEGLDPALVREAMSHPETALVTQTMIADGKIFLVHPKRRNTKLFQTQMSIIGEKGDRAGMTSPDAKR